MTTTDTTTARTTWLREGETFLAHQLEAAPLAAPSLLPGWHRAHLAAHVAGNADGLLNLLHWARTGIETPMYPSAEARLRYIDEWASRPDDELRARVRESAAALNHAINELCDDAWKATVRSALGRDIPASDVPWLRVREVWIHAIDLDAGAWFDALPRPLVDALLTEVCRILGTRDGCPNVTVAPDDRTRTWLIGQPEPQDPVARGQAADLLGWVTGRCGDQHLAPKQSLPTLPAWL